MSEVRRRSVYSARGGAGRGWRLTCRHCQAEVVTLALGRCPLCGEEALETLPAVLDEPRVGGVFGSPVLWGALCVFVAGLPIWPFMFLAGKSFLFVLMVAPIFYLACYPLSVPLILVAQRMWRSRFPRLEDGNRAFSDLMPIEKVWHEITKLRGRRGLVLHLSFRVAYQRGQRVEVVVRFRGPDGRYLLSSLRNYRGEYGEVRVRWSSKPLQNQLAAFPKVWMFVPMRAMELPPGTKHVQLEAEILITCQGEVHTERDHAIDFVPFPEDFPNLLTSRAGVEEVGAGDSLPPPGAIRILAAGESSEESTCGVCGDHLAGPVVRCSSCDTPHHTECWEYLGGCTTYACEGRPVAA